MDKVYFEAPNEFEGTMGGNAQIYMAKNDYEATQLVIFPTQDLTNIEVSVSDDLAPDALIPCKIDFTASRFWASCPADNGI